MDGSIFEELQEELMLDLTLEFASEKSFDNIAMTQKIKNAIREVKNARKYPSHYTETQIKDDMQNFYSNIRNIALYDYNKIGAEGQSSHSENSVSRAYHDRERFFSGVIPIAKI